MSKDKNPPVPPVSEAPYEVGYGKPPREHRFKAGISGNPRGRPKIIPKPAEVMARLIGRLITVTENGIQKKISCLEALLRQLISSGLKGNSRATEAILKMLLLYADESADRREPLDLAILTDEEIKVLIPILERMEKHRCDTKAKELKKRQGR